MSSADYVYIQLQQLASGAVKDCQKAIKGSDPAKALKLLDEIERKLRDLATHTASIPRR